MKYRLKTMVKLGRLVNQQLFFERVPIFLIFDFPEEPNQDQAFNAISHFYSCQGRTVKGQEWIDIQPVKA